MRCSRSVFNDDFISVSKEIGLQQYESNFVEEEMTSIALLEVSI